MARRILIVNVTLLLLCTLAGSPCRAESRRHSEICANQDSSISIPMPPTMIGKRTQSMAAGSPAWSLSCLGDSVTRGYPYGGTEHTYPAQLEDMFDQAYGSGALSVINHGVSGYRADQVLADMQTYNWMDEDPGFVLLMVGGNDIAQEATIFNVAQVIAETVADVQQIVDLINAHTNDDGSHPKIIVSAFIPNLLHDSWGSTAMALYNASLETNLTGVDLWTADNWDDFYDSSTNRAKTALMSDDVHPNEEGYLLMAENWFEAVESLLPQVYYVSLSGDDDNPGTFASPWRTIQHAADTIQPGDTVFVRTGTYVETVSFSTSGTEESPISFYAHPSEEVVIQGSIDLHQGVSFLKLSGFRLRDFSVWGVSLSGDNHHVTLSGLDVSGGDAGIHFTVGYSGEEAWYGPVSDTTVENCTVYDCEYSAIDCTPGPCDRMIFRYLEVYGSGLEAGFGGDGLAVERGQDILVEDCYIHDNGGDGIDLNSRNWDGNIPGIVVRRNRVVRNHLTGIKLWAGGRIENNLVTGQGLLPAMLGAFPSTYEVVNNTIAYNMYDSTYSTRNYAFLVGYPNDETGISAPVTLTLANNIFAFNTSSMVGGPTGLYLGENVTLTEHHNLYWSREDGEIQAEFVTGHDVWFARGEIANGTWTTYTGQGQGNVTSDPLLASGWPAVDLHLRRGSPAISAASVDLAPDEDLDGNPRPLDGGVDIGAYEYDSGLELTEGWNLVSLPRMPFDSGIESVLAGISGSYDLVFAYDHSDPGSPWRRYAPDAPTYVNELTELGETMGFWIHMTEPVDLPIFGETPWKTEILLHEGWNLVGYPDTITRTPSEAFAGISTYVTRVWAYDASDIQDQWKLYVPGTLPGVNDLTLMHPELGYWVEVNSDCVWKVPYE